MISGISIKPAPFGLGVLWLLLAVGKSKSAGVFEIF